APALLADALLEELGEEHYAHEIGRFNLEANLPVTHPSGSGLRDLEITLAERVGQAEAAAQGRGARVIPIGHLPTITEDLFTSDDWRAPGARYEALENSVLEARGEEIHLRIDGEGRGLDATFDSIAPESACTSMQLHLQVPPEQFADAWNAAQAMAGPPPPPPSPPRLPPAPCSCTAGAGPRGPPTPGPPRGPRPAHQERSIGRERHQCSVPDGPAAVAREPYPTFAQALDARPPEYA